MIRFMVPMDSGCYDKDVFFTERWVNPAAIAQIEPHYVCTGKIGTRIELLTGSSFVVEPSLHTVLEMVRAAK